MQIIIIDSEAERDWEEFVERRKERKHATVVGIFIGWLSMFVLLWVLS